METYIPPVRAPSDVVVGGLMEIYIKCMTSVYGDFLNRNAFFILTLVSCTYLVDQLHDVGVKILPRKHMGKQE